jgi:hypothetical protein
MAIVELIVTICAISQPSHCQDKYLPFAWNGSLRQCVAGAQPYIAQWIGEHPQWIAVRWRCDYAGKQKT